MVLIGVPNLASLEKTQRKLAAAGIVHYDWIEPGNDLGFTAIATVPLSREKKKVLANYRLWSPTRACSSEKEQVGSDKVPAGSVVQFHPGVPNLEMSASSLAAQSGSL